MPLDELDLDTKAVPDQGTLAADEFDSLAGQKVQLDIDDAPFLLDPDDEPAPLPAALAHNLPEVTEASGGSRKKKIILLAMAILALLAIGGGAAWYFLSPSAPLQQSQSEPPVIVVPTRKPGADLPKEYTIKLKPFWIPLSIHNDEVRFLVATFVLGTENVKIHKEIQDKLVTIRDAIFYYLCNKDYEFLMNTDNVEQIRADLVGTVNNYIVQGELKNLYFDSYLTQ